MTGAGIYLSQGIADIVRTTQLTISFVMPYADLAISNQTKNFHQEHKFDDLFGNK